MSKLSISDTASYALSAVTGGIQALQANAIDEFLQTDRVIFFVFSTLVAGFIGKVGSIVADRIFKKPSTK